jgi:hypothetical protein
MTASSALTTDTHEALVAHLDRPDGQEDLCFALYRPSSGASRTTALVHELILPRPGERSVHGNVSFTSEYFLRAGAEAASADAGLVFLHSHPRATGWQGMSDDDIRAEHGHSGQTLAMTGLPLVGMTLATGDKGWSARSWPAASTGRFERLDFETVRVVGDQLIPSFNPMLRPPETITASQLRTVSAWGDHIQAIIARLRVGIVGAGSVGSVVAEVLVRIGVQAITLIDFDSVKQHNLDRLLHAGPRDVRLARSKVETLKRGLLISATAEAPLIEIHELSLVEEAGLLEALDCDVLFSCVDRPWPRSALNMVAYAHLIPVIDGGIRVGVAEGQLERADWKAHIAAPGRRCLECLGQYDPGHVALERDGYLDDPTYIAGLPPGHPLKARENVFGFASHTASMEIVQFLSMVVAPHRTADIGAQNYHFVTGELDIDRRSCNPRCPYGHDLVAQGEATGLIVTGKHATADRERAERHTRARSLRVRLGRLRDRVGSHIAGRNL